MTLPGAKSLPGVAYLAFWKTADGRSWEQRVDDRTAYAYAYAKAKKLSVSQEEVCQDSIIAPLHGGALAKQMTPGF